MKEKREYVIICFLRQIKQKKKKKMFEINFTNTFEILQIIHLKMRDVELENSKMHFIKTINFCFPGGTSLSISFSHLCLLQRLNKYKILKWQKSR